MDVDEAAGELPVVLDQPVPNPEDIHATPRSCRMPLLRVTPPCNICKPPRVRATVGVHYSTALTLCVA